MDVTQQTNVATATAAASKTAEAIKAPTMASDFDTFLSLLTAQLNNQDPTQPMKSEEFASQLATFSMVEQQTYSNKLLESMAGQTGAADLASMSGWVDREVRAQMPVRYDGAPVTLDPEMPVAGTRHELVVTDASGRAIDRVAIGANGDQVEWTGMLANGQRAPAGVYAFSVESFEDGALVATEGVATYAAVNEVRNTREGPVLVFAGGVTVASADVTAIRRAT